MFANASDASIVNAILRGLWDPGNEKRSAGSNSVLTVFRTLLGKDLLSDEYLLTSFDFFANDLIHTALGLCCAGSDDRGADAAVIIRGLSQNEGVIQASLKRKCKFMHSTSIRQIVSDSDPQNFLADLEILCFLSKKSAQLCQKLFSIVLALFVRDKSVFSSAALIPSLVKAMVLIGQSLEMFLGPTGQFPSLLEDAWFHSWCIIMREISGGAFDQDAVDCVRAFFLKWNGKATAKAGAALENLLNSLNVDRLMVLADVIHSVSLTIDIDESMMESVLSNLWEKDGSPQMQLIRLISPTVVRRFVGASYPPWNLSFDTVLLSRHYQEIMNGLSTQKNDMGGVLARICKFYRASRGKIIDLNTVLGLFSSMLLLEPQWESQIEILSKTLNDCLKTLSSDRRQPQEQTFLYVSHVFFYLDCFREGLRNGNTLGFSDAECADGIRRLNQTFDTPKVQKLNALIDSAKPLLKRGFECTKYFEGLLYWGSKADPMTAVTLSVCKQPEYFGGIPINPTISHLRSISMDRFEDHNGSLKSHKWIEEEYARFKNNLSSWAAVDLPDKLSELALNSTDSTLLSSIGLSKLLFQQQLGLQKPAEMARACRSFEFDLAEKIACLRELRLKAPNPKSTVLDLTTVLSSHGCQDGINVVCQRLGLSALDELKPFAPDQNGSLIAEPLTFASSYRRIFDCFHPASLHQDSVPEASYHFARWVSVKSDPALLQVGAAEFSNFLAKGETSRKQSLVGTSFVLSDGDQFHGIPPHNFLPFLRNIVERLEEPRFRDLFLRITQKYPAFCISYLYPSRTAHPEIWQQLVCMQPEIASSHEHFIAFCKQLSASLDERALRLGYQLYDMLKKAENNEAKFAQLTTLAVESIQSLVSGGPPKTPYDEQFLKAMLPSIQGTVQQLTEQNGQGSVLQKVKALIKKFQIHVHSCNTVSKISDRALIAPRDVLLPCPSLMKEERYASILGNVAVLPTKTRPRTLQLLDETGREVEFLLKSGEDLRVDEGVTGVFRAVSSLLEKRGLTCQTYDVVPLTADMGLVKLVGSVTSCFKLYKGWLAHQSEITGTKPAKPLDGFFVKLKSLLKGTETSRREWPEKVLSAVYAELVRETPSSLIKDFMRNGSMDYSSWWKRQKRFTMSMAANTVVCDMLEIGDRHLDNILISRERMEVIHIDFNVSFGKGRRLRVPETVPVRLSRNFVEGLGFSGVRGAFKEYCIGICKKMASHEEVVKLIAEPARGYAKSDLHIRLKELEYGLEQELEEEDDDDDYGNEFVGGEIGGMETQRGTAEERVEAMIATSTEEQNLWRMYEGWMAWI